MVFSDTTNKLGLIQDCEMKLFGDNGYGQITNNPNRLLQFAARINRRQDRFIQLAFSADNRWQYDDSNYTDFPIATTNLVSGQRDYTFDVSMLEIDGVEILVNGEWRRIDPIDVTDNSATSIAYIENNSSNTGIPIAYDKTGGSVVLQPTPDYSATGGLRIRFKRGASYFVSTDTTKVPGFPSIFHDYLSTGAALDYAIDRNFPNVVNALAPEVLRKEDAILEHFSKRSKDEQKHFKPVIRSTR